MRLMNTSTFELSEYFGVNIPPYAILSHRWAESEVTFQDLQSGKGPGHPGWQKILGCCKQAKKDGFVFVWIDSCCIDKSSSAELSEAINSMFQWYQASEICYAYLSDVALDRDDTFESEFRASKWFTRGWTLQEFLAPQTVVFYNRDWVKVGDKTELESVISEVTGIEHLSEFQQASVAQKMSWASGRVTLRAEDMAYCLMGLFGVNMPLLYGEGEKAFLRLQIEIMRISDDESLFAWIDDCGGVQSGLLAQSPRAFKRSGNVELLPNTRKTPYAMTNKGLQIELDLLPSPLWIQRLVIGQHSELATRLSGLSDLVPHLENHHSSEITRRPTFVAALCCAMKDDVAPIIIALVKLSADTEVYSRVVCDQFLTKTGITSNQQHRYAIFIRQDQPRASPRGPTTLLLNLSHDESLEERYTIGRADFKPASSTYEGLSPLPSPAKAMAILPEFGIPDYVGHETRMLFTIDYGITTLEFTRQDRKHGFLVVVVIHKDKPLTVDVLPVKAVNASGRKLEEKYPMKLSKPRRDRCEVIHCKLLPGLYALIRVFADDRSGRHYGMLVKLYSNSAREYDIAFWSSAEYTAEYM